MARITDFAALIPTAAWLLAAASFSATPPAVEDLYLGQRLPGLQPRLFARGFVSTGSASEFGGNFHPDGTEYYFSRRPGGDGSSRILVTRLEADGWSEPVVVSFSGSYFDYHPCVSRNGDRLFFSSTRPLSGTGPDEAEPAIWMVEREGKEWSEPRHLGFEVHDGLVAAPEFVSITLDGSLYFGTSLEDGPSVVHRTRYQGGRYRDPEPVAGPVNAAGSNAHPVIAPDESFLVFDSTRPGGLGQGDLYISFRDEDGGWTEPIGLPAPINSGEWEVAPGFSHDGRYFFFFRDGDIYWVDARALGVVRPLVAAHSDYDGDGRADEAAFFRPWAGIWRIAGATGAIEIEYGRRGDIPVPGDYDGDGTEEVAVFRPATRQWLIQGRTPFRFGKTLDIPVPGDYDGDGALEPAVWRPATGRWLVRRGPQRVHGMRGDIPVPGDYDGDGRTDFAVWDPATGLWLIEGRPELLHGRPGDVPLVRGR